MVIQKSSVSEGVTNKDKNDFQRQLKINSIRREAEEKDTSNRAKKEGYGYLDLNILPIDPDSLKLVPAEEARKAKLAVIHRAGQKINVACFDPKNEKTVNVLKKMEEKGFSASLVMVSRSSLERAWSAYSSLDSGIKTTRDQPIVLKEEELSDFEKSLNDIAKFAERITSAPISETFNTIMAGAVKANSSDIHLEPGVDSVRLRYRIDGVLQDMAVFPKKIYTPFLNRIKMIGHLKLNVAGIPQNGRFTVNVGANVIDIRLAILPGVYGDDIVMRLLYQNAAALNIDNLGMRPEMMEQVQHEIDKPNGLILVTGPTGSGKTTTLYAFINHLNEPGTKIITIEDPVEYKIPGISQTAVNREGGYTFATGLSAILRQDPDIIMVGEIRDPDTASVGVQSALTGHLVFSTLHTNDAPGAIPRLIELGIRPSLIPSATNIIVAQRLIRKLCPFCKEKYAPAPETLEKIKKSLAGISPNSKIKAPKKLEYIWEAKGCPKCHLGFKGRIGIFEIFTITPKIEKLIMEMASGPEIAKAAIEEGMLTLKQDGLLKALEGISTIHEVERAAGEI